MKTESPDYAALYRGDYMRARWLDRAAGICRRLDPAWDIIEVGAGRGDLAATMRVFGYRWTAYDPVPGDGVHAGALPWLHASMPRRRYQCAVAIDVLEHLPERDISPALSDLRTIAGRGVWTVANMSDIHQINGVDVELHLTQRNAGWWMERVYAAGAESVISEPISADRFWLEVVW